MKKSIWLSLMDTQGMCHTMLFTTHVGTKTICKKVNLLSDSDTHKDPRNGGLGDKPTVFENHRKSLIQHYIHFCLITTKVKISIGLSKKIRQMAMTR